MRKAVGEIRGPAASPREIPSFAELGAHLWDNSGLREPKAALKEEAFPLPNVYEVLHLR